MVKGFTIIELMVTISITTIVALISIPPLTKFIERNKVSADVGKVVNIINTARSKAISAKDSITICGKDTTKSVKAKAKATQTCSRDWLSIKVLQKSLDNTIYQARLGANLESAQWYAFQNKPGLTIAPNGYTAHQNGSLYLCHNNYKQLHRAIIVSKSGRVTVQKAGQDIEHKCLDK